MNRRNFIKFLGKSTVAIGAIAVVGLPEIEEQEPVAEIKLSLSEEVEYEFIVPEETDYDNNSAPYYSTDNGTTWT